eukprot:168347_1
MSSTDNITVSPSKSHANLSSLNESVPTTKNNKNNNKKNKKKLKNRDSMMNEQKIAQHNIRDRRYAKYDPFISFSEEQCNDISIVNIVMSPDSEYGAFIDSFGRIWIWDCNKCEFVRIFKGYRRAQIGWIYVNKDIDRLMKTNKNNTNSSSSQSQTSSFKMKMDEEGRANIMENDDDEKEKKK